MMDFPLLPHDPEPKKKPGRKKLIKMPRLEVDFSLPPASQILPCKDAAQARQLEWNISDLRAVNETLDLYNKLPRICQGKNCFWAGQCPSAPDYIFQNWKCPLDIMDVYRNFYRYVVEMEVSPEDHADLKMVEDLVRIDLQIKHVDQQIQIQGMQSVKEVTMRNAVSREQVLHPLLVHQRGLRQDRNALYEKLILSRKDKKAAEAMDNKGKANILELMYRIKEAAEAAQSKKLQSDFPSALPGSSQIVPIEDLEDDEDLL